jgi:hypothetical protein
LSYVWTLKDAGSMQVGAGGRPAVRLTLKLANGTCDLQVDLTAFPGTPIVRLDNTLVNRATTPAALAEYVPFQLRVDTAGSPGDLYWMNYEGSVGMNHEKIAAGIDKVINGSATKDFLPWLGVTTTGRGGLFASLEYLGRWTLKATSPDGKVVEMGVKISELADYRLAPGEKTWLPSLVLGVLEDSLEDMSRHVYDWQYEFMWDMTNYVGYQNDVIPKVNH